MKHCTHGASFNLNRLLKQFKLNIRQCDMA